MTLGQLGRSLVNMDIFTDVYWVMGRAAVGMSGIHGEFSNFNFNFLDLYDAYISRIHEPGTIIASYNLAAFRKDNINFIVLTDRRDGVPVGTQHGRSIFTRGRPVPAYLTVPSFEIKGELIYEGKASPNAILTQALGRFLLIFSATASASLHPEINYSGDLILVHKERIGILCLEKPR